MAQISGTTLDIETAANLSLEAGAALTIDPQIFLKLEAADVHCPGASVSQIFPLGAVAADVHCPGAVTGEVN